MPPVHSRPVPLTPQGASSLDVLITSDTAPQLIDIFEEGELVLGVAVGFDGSGSSQDLQGTWQLTGMHAVVEGRTDLTP